MEFYWSENSLWLPNNRYTRYLPIIRYLYIKLARDNAES